MKNKINGGVTEVVTIEDMPRQVIPGTSEYDDAAWCPSCAARSEKEHRIGVVKSAGIVVSLLLGRRSNDG